MKTRFIIFFSLLALLARAGGDSLQLAECLKRAAGRYPLARHEGMLQEQSMIRQKNLHAAWFPQINLNAQASYQSEVTGIDLNLPFITITPPNKDQYRVSLDVGQLIYDGGQTAILQALETTDHDYQQRSLEADIYQIKEQVGQVYFALLHIQYQAAILDNLLGDLDQRMKEQKAALKEGLVLESNVLVLESEYLKTAQQRKEQDILRDHYLKMLGTWLDTTLDSRTKLALPSFELAGIQGPDRRIENRMFSLQVDRFRRQQQLLGRRHWPRISAFGQAGYGRPGLNMLSTDFESFYMVGIRLGWNFWNFNQTARERKMLGIQQKMTEVRQETFNHQIKIAALRQKAEMERFRELLRTDASLIEIRAMVSKSMAAQLASGVITASQYVSEKNQEHNARLRQAQHRVELARAESDYAFLMGNE